MARKKSIGAVLTLKDGDFRGKMRQSIVGFDKFQEASRRAQKGMGGFEGSLGKAGAKVKSLGRDLAGGALALIGVGSAAGLMSKAFNEGSSLEGYRNTLEIVMKDSKKAADTMKWAVDFANKTPFETGQTVEATAKLQAYGLTAKQVLPAVGNMASAMNKDLIQGVEAVADAQTGELERLKEFGITKQMIVDKANKIMRGKEVVNSKGQITDQKAFNKALFALMDERFKGGMERQANSMKGIWSTVTGTVSTGMAEIVGVTQDGTVKTGSAFDLVKGKAKEFGDTLVKWQKDGTLAEWGDNVSSAIRDVNSAVGFMKDVIIIASPVLGGLTTAFVVHKGVVAAAVIAQKAHTVATGISTIVLGVQCAAIQYQTVVAGGGSRALGLITAAQWLWNAAMTATPVGAVIVGIAALSAGIVILVKNWDKVTAAVKRAWEWLTKWRKGGGERANAGDFRQIEGNALGTSRWGGGLTWVGERGPELVKLPPGSRIHSNSQSTSITRNQQPITIIINGSGMSHREIIDAFVPELKLAMANM